jgi:hypothetical protein
VLLKDKLSLFSAFYHFFKRKAPIAFGGLSQKNTMAHIKLRKNGWTFIETLLVLATVGILASIFLPKLSTYWKSKKACNKAIKMHEEIAPAIRRLAEIHAMPQGNYREYELKEFRISEGGSVFFEEFCPAFAKCSKPTEIQKDYSVSLTLLCFEKPIP